MKNLIKKEETIEQNIFNYTFNTIIRKQSTFNPDI